MIEKGSNSQKGEKTKPTTSLWTVAGWLFGIIWLIAGLAVLDGHLVLSILYFAASALTLPPLYWRATSRIINLTRAARIGISIVLVLIAALAFAATPQAPQTSAGAQQKYSDTNPTETAPGISAGVEQSDACPNFRDSAYNFDRNYGLYVANITEYYGDAGKQVSGFRLYGGFVDQLSTANHFYTLCRAGNKPGENANYQYCGDVDGPFGSSPLQAVNKVIDAAGTIQSTVTKNIILVFNSTTGKFVNSICS